MKILPVLLAVLIAVPAFLVIGAEEVRASTTPVNPSTIPNSGYDPAINVSADGQRIAIAHRTSTNGVVLTYSINGGTSWTDKSVVAAGYGTLKVFAFSNTVFTVLYETVSGVAAGTDDLRAARTIDGGFSWTAYSIPAPVSAAGTTLLDADSSGNMIVAATARNIPGNAGNLNVYVGISYSPDQGVTWYLNKSIALAAGSWSVDHLARAAVRGPSLGNYSLIYDSYLPGFFQTRVPYQSNLVDGGSWSNELVAQDSFTAISAPSGGFYAAPGAPIGTGFFLANGAGIYFNLEQVGATSFQSYSTSSNVLSNAFYRASSEGFVASLNSLTSVQYFCSTNGGTSYTAQTVIAAGATNSKPAISVSTNTSHIAYMVSATGPLGYTRADGAGCPTWTVPGGGASGPGSGAFVSALYASNIVGFDVNEAGANVIIRNGTGANEGVRVYTGTLASASNPAYTFCARTDGVSIVTSNNAKTYAAYLVCTQGNSADVNAWAIRSASLGAPDWPSQCADFCTQNILDTQIVTPEDSVLDIADVSALPYDLGLSCFNTCTPDIAAIGFAFTTTDGRIGVVGYLWRNNIGDVSDADYFTLNTNGAALANVCTALDTLTDDTYVYGQGEGGVIGFKLYSRVQVSTSDFGSVDVALQPHFSNQASYPATVAIGCGDRYLLMVSNSQVKQFNTVTLQSMVLNHTGGLITSTAAAIDPKGVVGAFIDNAGSRMNAYYTANGTVFATRTIPTNGTIIDMQMDNYGLHAWIAMNNSVLYYDLTADSVYGQVVLCIGCDTDGDGIPNETDTDLDGDGVPNTTDPDIDGDGIPNATDTDDDADGVPDALDSSATGATGDTTVAPTGAASTTGISGLSGTSAIIASIATILGLAMFGWMLTQRRRKGGNGDGE